LFLIWLFPWLTSANPTSRPERLTDRGECALCISHRLMLSIMCKTALNVYTDKQAERPELLGS
jgi:hypothetical protein